LAGLVLLESLGLLNFRIEQIVQGIVAGIAVACFGRAVARALFAVDRPQARLVQEDDATARSFHNHLVWASRTLGLVIALQGVHKILFAPLVVAIATNVLFGFATAGLLLHLVFRLDRIRRTGGAALPAAAWARPLGLLMAILILLALGGGYSAFAAFVSLRVIVAAAVFGALYLLLLGTQTFFEGFGEQSAKGQKLAASLGVTTRSLGLGGTLVSALIRVTLVLLSSW
jgi:small-conductance mechanosensitive channel